MVAVSADSQDRLLGRLNPEQREAVTYCDGPLRVVAGAGTGKTSVITARFAYLVEREGVPADRILALTFSRKAADEMRHRIISSLSRGYRKLWMHTYHSFCLRILREIYEAGPESPELQVLSEIERRNLSAQVVSGLPYGWRYYNGATGQQQLVNDAVTLISRAKDYLIAPEDFEKFPGYAGSEQLHELALVYLEYQGRLAEMGSLDFAEIAYRLIRMVEADEKLQEDLASRFSHVIVDEFQDTNEGQYQLLKLLAPPPSGNLCIVGDPDQSIYAFRGAAREYMTRLEEDYPDLETVRLPTNYRSHEKILRVANALIANNPDDDRAVLASHDGETGVPVKVAVLSTEDDEAAFVAGTIKQGVRDGRFRYSDCAILCRSVKMSGPALSRALVEFDVPYQVAGLDPADYETIEDLLAALRIVQDEHNWPDIRRLVALRGASGFALRDLESSDGGSVDLLSLLALEDAQAFSAEQAEWVRLARETLAYLQKVKNEALDVIVYHALLHTGHMGDGLSPNKVELVRRLLGEAASAEEARMDLPALTEYLQETFSTDEDEPPGQGPGVMLLTTHAAKGLEWPVVFVTGLAEGRFPLPMRLDRALDLDEICVWKRTREQYLPKSEAEREVRYREEERRLCYVAFTRARRELCLTRARIYERETLPESPFVEEIAGCEGSVSQEKPSVEPRRLVELQRRLHINMMRALEEDVRSPQVAEKIADAVLGEWAGGGLPGSVPLHVRRTPSPHTVDTQLQLSYSQVEQYATCPRQYLYATVLRLSRETDATHSTNGTGVHRALQALNGMWKDTGRVPERGEILAEIDRAFDGRRVRFSLRSLERQARERARHQLLRYYDYERQLGRTPVAVEEKFTLTYGHHSFTGKIDCVMRGPDGSYELIDYKTGRGDDLKAHESLQLYIYETYWLDRLPGARVRVAYYLLKHKDKDRGLTCHPTWDDGKQARRYQHTPQSRQSMRARLDGLVESMLANRFEAPEDVKEETCYRCAYNFICADSLA